MIRSRFGRPAVCAACLLLVGGILPHCPLHAALPPPDLIVVPTFQKELLPVVAPLAARMAAEKSLPYVVVLPVQTAAKPLTILSDLNPRHTLFLNVPDHLEQQWIEQRIMPDQTIPQRFAHPDPAKLAVDITSAYNPKCEKILLAFMDETESLLLAATYAAHTKTPLIPVSPGGLYPAFAGDLETLGVNHITLVSENPQRLVRWIDPLTIPYERIAPDELTARLINTLTPPAIKNIILTRLPAYQHAIGNLAWLAPYLSLLHGSPVMFCDDSDATNAQEKVRSLIEQFHLMPRSLTILADYDSIGLVLVRDETLLQDYEVPVEPCSRSGEQFVAGLAVGRFPFVDLTETSCLVAQTLRKIHHPPHPGFRMLMVANPGDEYGPLPLAETVSRATAEEFKNFRIPVDEFYGTPAHDPQVRATAARAHLIVFEGHVSDQFIFQNPLPYDDQEFDSESNAWQPYSAQRDDPEPDRWARDASPASPHEHLIAWEQVPPLPSGENTLSLQPPKDDPGDPCRFSTSLPADTDLMEESPSDPPHFGPPPEKLLGWPVVVLQSCHSLEAETARAIFDLGGVAILGTLTNIHSASGSTFVKSFCDALLYRRETLGDALRDARNYYLSLADLKSRRGHREQAKVYRVALSFCLWGDPELHIMTSVPTRTRRRPLSADFVAPDRIKISLPDHHLPTSRTEQYQARLYPGAQVAGLVKRLLNRDYRRLMPLYFFKLPYPPQLRLDPDAQLIRRTDRSARAGFIVDSSKKWLYILYFPYREKNNDILWLQFTPPSNSVDNSLNNNDTLLERLDPVLPGG